MWQSSDFSDFFKGGSAFPLSELRRRCEYGPNVGPNDRHVQLFWCAMAQLSEDRRRRFMNLLWRNASGGGGSGAAAAGDKVAVPPEATAARLEHFPAPFRVLQPTALALLSPDAAEMTIFEAQCAVALPRFSTFSIMRSKLLLLLGKME